MLCDSSLTWLERVEGAGDSRADCCTERGAVEGAVEDARLSLLSFCVGMLSLVSLLSLLARLIGASEG